MISSPTSRAAYTLSSTTETLPVPFYFLENSHLRVIKTVGGVDTQLFIGTHFTATGAGVLAGGAITLTGTGVAVGNTITIKRLVPLTQLVDYVANSAFPADTHEKALDKLTMICQYLGDEVLRSLRLQESEAPILPLSLNDRKGKGLMFDATTGEVEFYDVQDVLDAADAAAASEVAAQAAAEAAAGGAGIWTEKSANFTAANDGYFRTTATLTVANPTGVEGKGYVVDVRSGTATIGGTAYAAPQIIYASFAGGLWGYFPQLNASLSNLAPRASSGISYNPELTVAGVDGRGRMVLGTKASLITTDGALVIARELSGNAAQGAHAVRDESSVDMAGWGLKGYASYDSLVNVSDSGTVNHVRGFQARPIFSGSGTCQQLAGMDVGCVVNNGSGHTVEGLRVRNVTINGGSVALQYGLRLDATSGATTNITLSVGGPISQIFGQLQLPTGTESNSTTTGVLRATGGLGVTGNIYLGGLITAGGLISAGTEFRIGATRIMNARKTGWATPTAGAQSRAAFDPATVTLVTLAQTLNALIQDCHASTSGHGLIGN